MIERRTGQTAAAQAPEPQAEACAHADPLRVRLIEYTRYGTWIGCIDCGTSWLVRGASEVPEAAGRA